MSVPRTAIVVGCGIAGPVVAVALKKAGIEPVVYERHQGTAEGVGAFLGLGLNGIDALRAIEMDEPVLAEGFATPRMIITDHDHPPRAVRSAARRGDPPRCAHRAWEGPRWRRIHRRRCARTLRRRQRRRSRPAHRRGRHPFDGAAHDRPGCPETDLRRVPEHRRLRAGRRGAGEPGVDHLVFGRKPSCGYVKDPTGEVWWFANPPARTEPDPETLAAIPASRWREQLTELFTEDSTAALQVIGHTERIFSGWITYDMPTVPSWHNDRMIIIGDAAHAVSPSAGQGASVAIEDAVVLAECLRDLPDVPRAFAHYEQLRRDRVQRIVAQGRHNGGGKTVGPVGRVLRDAIMPFAVRIMFRGGRDPFAWMWNHHIDWDAPIEGERPVRSYDVGSSWPSPQG